MAQYPAGPWSSIAEAGAFLRYLAGLSDEPPTCLFDQDQEAIAVWLEQQGLGPLAFARSREELPELAQRLQKDHFSAVAENAIRWQILDRIGKASAETGLKLVALKGVPLAEEVYGARERRTMSDIDLWVPRPELQRAAQLLYDLGFSLGAKHESRPMELVILSDGAVPFYLRRDEHSLVEIHLFPFKGWWLKHTAKVDERDVWERRIPLEALPPYFQLSREDMLLHLIAHLAVNHQFGQLPVRAMMDIVLASTRLPVDWATVTSRAQRWRLGNSTWLVMNMLCELFDLSEFAEAERRLRPPRWRCEALQKLVSVESVVSGHDIRDKISRYLFLLLLVDRPQDSLRLALRALWPEKEWLDARYRGNSNHWQHIWKTIRARQI